MCKLVDIKVNSMGLVEGRLSKDNVCVIERIDSWKNRRMVHRIRGHVVGDGGKANCIDKSEVTCVKTLILSETKQIW